jgi:hypothetical protein
MAYVNNGGNSDTFSSNQAPANDATTAGRPKRKTTLLSAFLPTRISFKTLLKKCTMPVSAMASSIGKKMANTGVRIVPSPNPEKKVSRDVIKAAMQIRKISIMQNSLVM